LQVTLDRAGVTHMRFRWIAPRFAQGATLAEQVPAAVQFDLYRAKALLICVEELRVRAVYLLAPAKFVLLGHKALDS
jgi:hypothetical protein